MQDLMATAIKVASKTLFSACRRVLQAFTSQKRRDGVDEMLFRLYNPIICEGCTWTYNERNRKLEISLTKDSDTIVWCAAFLAKDAEGNVPLDYEEEAAERERMERFLPKRF